MNAQLKMHWRRRKAANPVSEVCHHRRGSLCLTRHGCRVCIGADEPDSVLVQCNEHIAQAGDLVADASVRRVQRGLVELFRRKHAPYENQCRSRDIRPLDLADDVR